MENKIEVRPKTDFKKPILIGKIGRLPRKFEIKTPPEPDAKEEPENAEEEEIPCDDIEKRGNKDAILEISLPYKEPSWSGIPATEKAYSFEVLKSGNIIESINLMSKSLWVFGRLADCDVCMAHPTISRYHAILQYRNTASEDHPVGFYLYDLGSTHGTFLNKSRLKTRVYARVQVGHMIKLGCSTRTYLLTGPEDDEEEESQLSISELKQKRADDLKKREDDTREAAAKRELELAERKKKEAERGIDWGMGDDADEETDLSENPYAQTNNEELYLDDPKKALRGFMEREGIDLEYDCSEQGIGQFLCKVQLPLDDEKGRPIVAEVLHKGKKKECVVQCALEACRILDRHGVLRQATHESRKRKAKNWEENDYYDSDDDTFLDRTGAVEKKRENRMRAKAPQNPETYDSLLKKEQNIGEEIKRIERQLKETRRNKNMDTSDDTADSLESFMKDLSHSKLDKQKISKLKSDLMLLKKEHANVIKLVNIARPADLPPLKPTYETESVSTKSVKSKGLPIFGKRMKVKLQLPERSNASINYDESDTEKEYYSSILNKFNDVANRRTKPDDRDFTILKQILMEEKQFCAQHHNYMESIVTIASKIANLKTRNDPLHNSLNRLLEVHVEANNTRSDIFRNQSEAVKKVEEQLKAISEEPNVGPAAPQRSKSTEEVNEEMNETERNLEIEKKKKRNQKRIMQRQGKQEIHKSKGYVEDSLKEDYNMWVPPNNQSGDGRTSLNEKLGY